MTNELLAEAIKAGQSELILELWEQIRPWIEYRARTVHAAVRGRGGTTVDDLIQSGYFALLGAIETYDSGKGSFVGWLSWYLKREFAAATGGRARSRDPLDFAQSLDATTENDDGEVSLIDLIPDVRNEYEDADRRILNEELHDALDCAINALPPAQAEVIRAQFWRGKTLSEIAEKSGEKRANIYSRRTKALRAIERSKYAAGLREYLDENTDYYRGVSARAFRTSNTSPVERAVIKREMLTYQWLRKPEG